MEGALSRAAALALCLLALACGMRGPGIAVRPPAVEAARSAAERTVHYDRAMQRLREYRERLDRVFAPIAVESAGLCGRRVAPWTGLALIGPREFADWSQHLETQADLRAAAGRVLGMRDGATVYGVAPGSPAAAARVAPGDVLERANGRRVRHARDLHDALARAPEAAPRLELRRGAERIRVELARVPACEAFLLLSIGPNVFAYASDRGITISTGMLDRLASDDELAFILSHELAHRMLDSERTSPKQAESMADYLACYFVARAGYDVARLPSLWRRWAEDSPLGITRLGATHPGTPERALLLEATAAEIERKRASGEPLDPERPSR